MLKTFPYPIITVDGAKAEEEWLKLKTYGQGWPVVIGDDQVLEQFIDEFSSRNPNEILAAAEKINLSKDLLAWHRDEWGESVSIDDDLMGEWPINFERYDEGLSVARNILTNAFYPKVHIVIVPTEKSWEAPAYLKWGGWNSCPPPEFHVAIFKEWHEKFGAEVAGMSIDTVNLRIVRPVANRDDALSLAKQQYLYCGDNVDQGTGSISNLAATLIGQRWWFFWWD